jgi:protein associated with RNAse G/E
MEVKIEVGLGAIEVYLQYGLPVKIYAQDTFLSSVDMDDFHKERKGIFISRDWDESAFNRMEMDLEVGLGSISVHWEK